MTTPVQPLGSDALPLMSAANPAIGQNNQRDIAKYLLQALLVTPGASGFIRRGVLHRGNQVAGVPQELLVTELGPSGNVQVTPGYFWVHRGAISGPDNGARFGGFHGTTPFQVNLPAPSGLNSRYDGVFAKIIDKNMDGGATDAAESPHGPSIDVRSGMVGPSLVLAGTPGTAGAPPTTPDGYLPLAFIARATGVTNVVNANITDVRRGTTIPGVPRTMFPWDVTNIAGDTGYVLGEERWRPAAGIYPAFLDYWDGTVWRGTRGHTFAEPAQTSTATVVAGAMTQLNAGITIPWPGFPYRVEVAAEVEWSVSFSSGNSRTMVVVARLDTAAYVDTTGAGSVAVPRTFVGPPATVAGAVGGILGFKREVLPSGGLGHAVLDVPSRNEVVVSDGATHTLYFLLQNKDDTSTYTIIRGVPYRCAVRIVPA